MTLKVNGEVIPTEAIEFELARLIQFYSDHMSEVEVRKQIGVLKDRAKQQAIGAKLLIDEASKLDIQVSDDEVRKKLNEMIEGAGGRDKFDAILEKQKLSEEVVCAGIARSRKVDLLVDKFTEGISDPSEEEMREHFKSHAHEYANPARASAQHILLSVDKGSNDDAKATARARLEAIKRDIEGGANFADQATMHSDCPSGKQAGGSLGWFSQGMMAPEIDKAVFSMDVGQVSDVVESTLGFHLIHKTGQQDSTAVEYDDVRDKVRDFLRHAARGEALSEHVQELKEKAVIEEA
jgi:parvulin-like peptidyl-prolyl isomerase